MTIEYFTSQEKEQLEEELKQCVSKRKIITDRIAQARELGDLSENAEYHAAREDQGMNEARIKQLEQRLSQSVVTEADTVPADMVFIGSTVKLRDTNTNDEELYKLVGDSSGSFDQEYMEVTPNSPMGTALMKARVGEVIRVNLRRGTRHFEIVEIIT